jgi:hypothetical protein
VERVEDRVELSPPLPAATSNQTPTSGDPASAQTPVPGSISPVPPAVTPSPAPPLETAPIDDESIETQIQARYFNDPLVKDASIDVSSSNGTVTLSGIVSTPEARDQAVRIAREMQGVSRVEDKLQVGAR